jgi:hypothetical protein
MSTIKAAPTLSAISRRRFEVNDARIGAGAAQIELGLCSRASSWTSVVADTLSFLVHAIVNDVEEAA